MHLSRGLWSLHNRAGQSKKQATFPARLLSCSTLPKAQAQQRLVQSATACDLRSLSPANILGETGQLLLHCCLAGRMQLILGVFYSGLFCTLCCCSRTACVLHVCSLFRKQTGTVYLSADACSSVTASM